MAHTSQGLENGKSMLTIQSDIFNSFFIKTLVNHLVQNKKMIEQFLICMRWLEENQTIQDNP